jgi:ankyrin repeat protein
MSQKREDIAAELAKAEKKPSDKPSAAAEDLVNAGNRLLTLIATKKKPNDEEEAERLTEIDAILAAHNVANFERYNNSRTYTRTPLLRAINKRYIDIVIKVVDAGGKITDEVLLYALTQCLPEQGATNSKHQAEFREILNFLLERSKNYNFRDKVKLKSSSARMQEFSGLSYILRFAPKSDLLQIFLENGALIDQDVLIVSLRLENFVLFESLLKKYLAINPSNEIGVRNILTDLDSAASSLGLTGFGMPADSSSFWGLEGRSNGGGGGGGGGSPPASSYSSPYHYAGAATALSYAKASAALSYANAAAASSYTSAAATSNLFSLETVGAVADNGSGGRDNGAAANSSSSAAASASNSAGVKVCPVKTTLRQVLLAVCCTQNLNKNSNFIKSNEAAASAPAPAPASASAAADAPASVPVSFYAQVAEKLVRLGVEPDYYFEGSRSPHAGFEHILLSDSGCFLFKAVLHSRRDVASILLSYRARVDQSLENGMTSLMKSVELDDVPTAQLLLHYKASITASFKPSEKLANGGSRNVIEFAVNPWKSQMVGLLLDESLPPDTIAHNMPIVFHAIENGDEAILRKLKAKGVRLDIEVEYRRDSVKVTPFTLAARLHNNALIKIMHDINSISPEEKLIAIWHAVTGNDSEMFQELLSKLTTPAWTINSLESPLVVTIRTHRNLVFAQKLIRLGLFIQWTDSTGKNALQHEMLNPNWDSTIVRGLIEKGLSANTLLENGETPIFPAIRRDDEPLVRFLMANGASLNHIAANGNSPLNETMHSRKPKYLALFLAPGAGLSEPIKQRALFTAVGNEDQGALLILLNNTQNLPWAFPGVPAPLVFALTRKNVAAARTLIEWDRFINWVDSNQEGALAYAIRGGLAEIVKLLMERAVDCTTPLNGGVMPFHLACQCHPVPNANADIFELLIGKTPDLSATDNEGLGGLHYSLIARRFKNAHFFIYNSIGITTISKNGMHALHVLFTLISKESLKSCRSVNEFTILFEAIRDTLRLLLKRGCLVDGEAAISARERVTPLQILEKSCAEVIKLITDSPLSGQQSAVNRNSIWTSPEAKSKAVVLINEILTIYRHSLSLMAEASKKVERVLTDTQQEELHKILNSVLRGGINARSIVDGKTALHRAVESGNSSLACVLMCAGASVTALDRKQESVLTKMSKELRCIQIVSQVLIAKLQRLHGELEKDYAVEAEENAKNKEKAAVQKPDELQPITGKNAKAELEKIRKDKIDELIKLGKEVIKEFDAIERSHIGLESEFLSRGLGGGGGASASVYGLESSSGASHELESDNTPSVSRLAFIQFRDKMCFFCSNIFYHHEKIRPWFNEESLEIAENLLSKISKGSTVYSRAQTMLFRLQSLHKESTKEMSHEHTKRKLQSFLNTIQITLPTDPTLRAQRELDHMTFVRYAAEYVLGDSMHGFRDHSFLDANFIMELLESFRKAQLDKEKLLLKVKALEEAREAKPAQKSNEGRAAPSAAEAAVAASIPLAVASSAMPAVAAAATAAVVAMTEVAVSTETPATVPAAQPLPLPSPAFASSNPVFPGFRADSHKRKAKDISPEKASTGVVAAIHATAATATVELAAGVEPPNEGSSKTVTVDASPAKKPKLNSSIGTEKTALGNAVAAAATIKANVGSAAANSSAMYLPNFSALRPAGTISEELSGAASMAFLQQAFSQDPNVLEEIMAKLKR